MVALGGGPPVTHGPIAVLGAGDRPGPGVPALVPQHDTVTRSCRPRGATSTWLPRTPLEHGLVAFLTAEVRPCVVRACALRPGAGRRVRVPGRRARLPRHDQAGHSRRAGFAPVRTTTQRRRSRSARWLGHRSHLRDGPVAVLLVLGAVAGNLGLMVLATGGVFVAGGIAPRVPGVLASRRVPRGLRSQGATAHIGGAHARLRDPRAARPAWGRDRGRYRSHLTFPMGTLEGFPNPPAMTSDRQSRSTLCARVRTPLSKNDAALRS